MLTHNPSPKSARWRYALILPLLSLSLYFSACTRDAVAPSSEGYSAKELGLEAGPDDFDMNGISKKNLVKKGEPELVFRAMSPGYTPIKAWKTTETQEFELTLSEDVNYMIRFVLPDRQNVDGVVVALYDSKDNKLAQSYMDAFKGKQQVPYKDENGEIKFREEEVDRPAKYFPGWTYKCTTTGKYKLRVTHQAEYGVERAVLALGYRESPMPANK